MNFENTLAFAQSLDAKDMLKNFRERFYIPQHNGTDTIYFTGNSLGLQPKSVSSYIQQELDDWAKLGVEGHFHAKNPWLSYHEIFPPLLTKIIGCQPNEVVVMNQLTVNLHLLMVSFYRPAAKRYKIICEAKAFPSDQYAFESQVRYHGFDPADAIIEVSPREGEHTIRTEDILSAIRQHADETALVLFGAVNYYTGQLFDIKKITDAAHAAGAYAGFDLAHAAGNVELKLHEWNVDFASWCSYKYLNSGPGSVSGIYIHEKHVTNKELPRFAGWWGYTKATRFKMEKGFEPIPSAEGWQISNAPVLSMAAHKASLAIFDEAGMDRLITKAKLLSGYLHFILDDINKQQKEKWIEVITPAKETERGCQSSMLMLKKGKEIFSELTEKGVVADWREPNVIRIAPVPLYNTFEDVWKFGEIMRTTIDRI
ncbi:kynureninase [Terrimonas pollutisoli]|uniref:kynureninase n=1 Tax=Terrimonas pollutisoli TaxID=3034147 RepID=UPI0023EAC6FA|nr:kynureninase [Terrimonas sp. H1YJ31]